jgi:hypothetical protein
MGSQKYKLRISATGMVVLYQSPRIYRDGDESSGKNRNGKEILS